MGEEEVGRCVVSAEEGEEGGGGEEGAEATTGGAEGEDGAEGEEGDDVVEELVGEAPPNRRVHRHHLLHLLDLVAASALSSSSRHPNRFQLLLLVADAVRYMLPVRLEV